MKKLLIIFLPLLCTPLFAEPHEQSNTLSAIDGRFVLGQISERYEDQYLLDTKTGRLWVGVKIGNGVNDPAAQKSFMPVLFFAGENMASFYPDLKLPFKHSW